MTNAAYPFRCPLFVAGFLAACLAGCGKDKGSAVQPISETPKVQVTKPQVRTIVREVGQPSFAQPGGQPLFTYCAGPVRTAGNFVRPQRGVDARLRPHS